MSFSYIKTVFPKFESSKVYNDQLYSNINSPTAVPPTPTAVPVSFLSPHSQQLQGFDLQNQTIIKGTVETNVEKFAPVSKDNYLTSIPNLKYYNVPIPPQNVVQLPRASPQLLLDLNQQQEIEKFENGGTKCNNIVKHISECSYCRYNVWHFCNIVT
jgi:hypothetical protein